MSRRVAAVCLLLCFAFATTPHAAIAQAADGNRLAYLDGPLDPYYPHRDFPKLTTPQWVGEEGVECVVTLAIDDMRDSAKYEAFLRPILDRLKKIDGRAPVSIMSCRARPDDPQLQAWLKEGLSIEVHTYDHPCPMFQDGGLGKAKETYDKCVDLMNEIPGNKPVAYRMPCCDSRNTPTPRFWAEIFNKTTEKGNFLQIDSSVFNIITNKDKELPKEITELPDGSERFRRYVPFANFVNTIEDYPYPYVIGGMCWEFPCVVPSDWSAQHVQQPNNPDTVRDWKLALDACVIKQGTFNLVFHPHGWIRNDQIVELIDHAVEKHGKKVKFLTFRECAERLNRNLLEQALRDGLEPTNVQLIDQNQDGYIDLQFFYWRTGGSLLDRKWDRTNHRWIDNRVVGSGGCALPGTGYLQRDVDGDGEIELIEPHKVENDVPHGLALRRKDIDIPGPDGTMLFDKRWQDAGLRLIDVNNDGMLDALFSNHERYCLYLFKDMKEGWATKVFDVERGKEDDCGAPAIPPFVRADGTNNGAWFHSGALWLMNEDTWKLPDNVFKLTFEEMLGKKEAGVGGQESGDTNPTRKRGDATPKPAVGDQGALLGKPAVAPKSVLRRAAQFVAQQVAAEADGTRSVPTTNRIDMPAPTSPQESLQKLHVRPGFKIELVAAEPLVVDPVAFDWGPDGRLWVVEMRDYPSGITWNREGDTFGEPGGRVKVLTDTDGDGKYDKAEVFLDKIAFPTGVKVWRKGILVTAAPEILYAEDTDGDDKADVRKTLYRGFGEGNQQHRVNGLRWGLDNWLYVGNGDSGGMIEVVAALGGPLAPRAEDGTRSVPTTSDGTRSVPATSAVSVAGRDLRIRPDTGQIDPQSGQTQFGRERDDWGNWFGGNNSNPLWHYTLEEHYLGRNPHFAPPPNKKQVSVFPGPAPVYPRSVTLTRFNDADKANRFTSACGQALYRDELLGSEFYHNSFVCEPVHNLVAREIVAPEGTTFTSRRADDEKDKEFLASEDNWFRPSMCRTGPDGALWVADMYRFVIEHPKWIPDEFMQQLEIRAGEDKGRIYRIYHEDRPPRLITKLDQLDIAGLVAALDSMNGPQRDLAHQMLVWLGDKAAASPLTKLMLHAERPHVRLQALCTLDGLEALTPELVNLALDDKHPAVVRHAVRLAEPWLGKVESINNNVLASAHHDDPHVRQQVAYSLGVWNDRQTAAVLARLLTDKDPYITAAAMSSLNKENVGPILAGVLAPAAGQPQPQLVEQVLSVAAAMGNDAAVREAFDAILQRRDGVELWQLAALGGLLDALERRKIELTNVVGGDARRSLASVFDAARRFAAGEDRAADDEALRLAAIRLLGRGLERRDEDAELLASLLLPQQPASVQSAAVAALARLRRADLAAALLAGWSAHTPGLRQQILDVLLARDDATAALLDAIEKGQVAASHLDARRRSQILRRRSDDLRRRADKLLAGSVDRDRHKLVETYLSAAEGHSADAARGKEVFAKRCANCHKLDGVGHSLGPDLTALTDRSPTALYTAMLDPNRAVEDKFLEYVVLDVDGVQHTGMLLEETGASLTLGAPDGKRIAIPRSQVERLMSSGKSLMPEGIEKDIAPAEMADLVAYLRQSKPPPKQLAGNTPEVVRPFTDGSIRLLATNCRAYGPTIKMEETYRALGWWNSLEDHAVWSFEVPAGAEGEYRVTLDYSCDDASAGNTLVLEVAGQSLGGQVASSGGWDKYRGWNLGTVKLPAGEGELLVRSQGPINGALLDLRGVRLAPVR